MIFVSRNADFCTLIALKNVNLQRARIYVSLNFKVKYFNNSYLLIFFLKDCNDFCPCEAGCPEGCKNCDNPLCSEDSPADHQIMVIPEYLSKSYSISGDGKSLNLGSLSAPSDDYAMWSAHAIFNDQLFIFGGDSDRKKVKLKQKNLRSNFLLDR